MSEHPNARRAREGFERFVAGDPEGLLGLFADDAVWIVPGANAMTGAYRGRAEILPFLRRTRELTDGTYQVELLWVVADDERVVPVYRAWGERADGRTLDIEQALFVRVEEDGLWTEVRALPLDMAAFDRFWA